MNLRQIHTEDVFGSLLGQVWMSRSKVKVTRDKKRAVHSHNPRQQQNGTCLLQITSCSSRRHHSVAAGRRVISAACVRFMFRKTSLARVWETEKLKINHLTSLDIRLPRLCLISVHLHFTTNLWVNLESGNCKMTDEGGSHSMALSMSVCVSLRLHISKTTCPGSTKFSVDVICGHGSVQLW